MKEGNAHLWQGHFPDLCMIVATPSEADELAKRAQKLSLMPNKTTPPQNRSPQKRGP